MLFYFIGIKGTGMSSLANVLVDLGHQVRGVDYNKKCFTEATLRQNIVLETFDNYNLPSDAFYIIGNIFKHSDIVTTLDNMGYKHMDYPVFIESFFKMKHVGIAGSHGKTTTALFTAYLDGKKSNLIIGDGTGFGVKKSKYLILEACEYRNTFLNYSYDYLAITNIDYDHPDFFKTEAEYVYAFQKAALKAQTLIYNYDDPNLRKIIHKNKVSFGFKDGAKVKIKVNEANTITLILDDNIYTFDVPFVGIHLAYDFAASFILSYLMGNNIKDIIERSKKLVLPKRRLNEKIVGENIIVDDYAHHPTEIRASISALRLKYPGKKLLCVFEPHTYTRTEKFLKDYINALKGADEVYIMPVFSSVREAGKESNPLLDEEASFLSYDLKTLKAKKGYIILYMGAGDVSFEVKKW